MPADTRISIPIGGAGLNLRSAPADLELNELSDSLNWQLDRSGALIKRTGIKEWGVAAPAPIIELMALRIADGVTYLLAQCTDGVVYSTTDGATWAAEDSGLSTDTPVAWAQFNDTLYWGDGSGEWRSWDGSATTLEPDIPLGVACCVWRNRFWVASGRSVFWSAIGQPSDFATYPLNTVLFPNDTDITALVAVQNVIQSPDGSDGVIVFTENRTHRIYDDSDNAQGVIVGGANVLVDTAVGCVSPRTIVDLQGEIMFLGRDGLYSSDGHGPARLESIPIDPLLRTFAWGQAVEFCACNLNGRYLLSYAPAGASANTRMLEVYTDLPRHADLGTGYRPSRRYGWYTYMAHTIAASALLVLDDDVNGTIAYMAHANPGDEAYVRQAFQGGYDVSGSSTHNPITASARTGANTFGTVQPKRLRMASMHGKGQIALSVSPDLQASVGESRVFDLSVSSRSWGVTDSWGSGAWSGAGSSKDDIQFYTQRGRYLTLTVTESSTDTGEYDRTLGYPGAQTGGAAIYSLILKVTPLDAQ